LRGGEAGHREPAANQLGRPEQHGAIARHDQRLGRLHAVDRQEDRVLDVLRPGPGQVHAQHGAGVGHRDGDVDQPQRLAGAAWQQPGQHDRVVHVPQVRLRPPFLPPRPRGHVLADEHPACGRHHLAAGIGQPDPRVQRIAALHGVQFGLDARRIAQLGQAQCHQLGLAVPLEHGPIEPAGGLVRQLRQVGADAGTHLVAGGALGDQHQHRRDQHRQQREGEGQPAAQTLPRTPVRRGHGAGGDLLGCSHPAIVGHALRRTPDGSAG
jgi:hypothetical protein